VSTLFGLLFAFIAAPALGALLLGLDRRLTARAQRRVGPPVLQPVYDALKLWGKEPVSSSPLQAACAWGALAGSVAAVALLCTGQDLLVVFFTQAAGAILPAVGALASPSPYAKTGGQRELLLLAAYEPVLLLVLVNIGLASGGTVASGLGSLAPLELDGPLLFRLPLAFLALLLVTGVKLRKSPFDVAASAHAHQELVRGVYTDYSGRNLALLELAHFYDTALLFGLCALFWATGALGAAVLVGLVWLGEIILDNASARLSWKWVLGALWGPGLLLAALNLLLLPR
jgi:ech hydrogenase subunit B